MTSLADVLIVIPCLNEEAHLPGLLARLVEESGEALIVVADGGSRDRSVEIVQEIAARNGNVRLLPNPRRLQSAAVNLAARTFGQGRRWLVRIDAHCGYPAGYARGLVAAAERTGAASVVAPMVTRGEACFQRACATAQNSRLGTGGSAHRHVGEGRFVDHGHHALMALDAFLAVGGYDEQFSHNEDAELDVRLTRAGGRIWLEPALAIVYHPRKTVLGLARQYFKYGEGRARTAQRHLTPLKARQALPLAIAPIVLVAILGGPFFWPLAIPAAVWAAACLGFGLWLGFRDRSLCASLSGVAAMVMHFAWSAGFLQQRLLRPAPGPGPEPVSQG